MFACNALYILNGNLGSSTKAFIVSMEKYVKSFFLEKYPIFFRQRTSGICNNSSKVGGCGMKSLNKGEEKTVVKNTLL